MVTRYVGGRKIGSWAEAEKLFAEAARTRTIETSCQRHPRHPVGSNVGTKEGRIMVDLYVADERVGSLDDAPRLIAEYIRRNFPIEFRNESGELVGRFFPVQEPTPPEPLIPWEPDIIREEIERRLNEPGYTIDEVRKKLDWA